MAMGWQEWALTTAGGALTILVARELKKKDDVDHRIDAIRAEFSEALDSMATRFTKTLDSLNQTIASLAVTAGKFEAVVAREYATRHDLKEVKDELRREFEKCQENCASRKDNP